jgi:hypothetical protein
VGWSIPGVTRRDIGWMDGGRKTEPPAAFLRPTADGDTCTLQSSPYSPQQERRIRGARAGTTYSPRPPAGGPVDGGVPGGAELAAPSRAGLPVSAREAVAASSAAADAASFALSSRAIAPGCH